MKFYDYQHYLNYYTEEFTYLGERGDSRYYDDKMQDHIVKVPSESSLWCDGNHQGTQPTIFYRPEAVKVLRDVWQHEWDYDDADMFDQDLDYAESLERI